MGYKVKKETADSCTLNSFVLEHWRKWNECLCPENIAIDVKTSTEVTRRLTDEEKHFLTQIFGNVRSNSIKAIWGVEQEEEYYENRERFPDINGKIIVSTRKIDGETEISISDNGHGIPAERIDDVLKGVWSKRIRPVRRKTRGIHLIHDALSRLNGSMKLESEYGKGTTVYIYLP